jgi:hypothetical protein
MSMRRYRYFSGSRSVTINTHLDKDPVSLSFWLSSARYPLLFLSTAWGLLYILFSENRSLVYTFLQYFLPTILPSCRPAILPSCYPAATWLLCHPATACLSCYPDMPLYLTVLPSYHPAILPFCRPGILLSCRAGVLLSCSSPSCRPLVLLSAVLPSCHPTGLPFFRPAVLPILSSVRPAACCPFFLPSCLLAILPSYHPASWLSSHAIILAFSRPAILSILLFWQTCQPASLQCRLYWLSCLSLSSHPAILASKGYPTVLQSWQTGLSRLLILYLAFLQQSCRNAFRHPWMAFLLSCQGSCLSFWKFYIFIWVCTAQ